MTTTARTSYSLNVPSTTPESNRRTPRRPPEELTKRPQWVGWDYGKVRANGKRQKKPLNPRTGKPAKTNDPTTWSSYEIAKAAAKLHGWAGVGYVLTEHDPFVGIDEDGCRDPKTGELAQWALEITEELDTYTEVSPSGTGIKLLARGRIPGPGTNAGSIEMYDRRQFFTITGDVLGPQKTIQYRQEAIERLYRRCKSKNPTPTLIKEQESPQAPVPLGDKKLLSKARNARDGALFTRLYYHGDTIGFPSHSEADACLMGKLAFWTGKDAERMERLFNESALGRREKWRTRTDYREGTIRVAIARCKNIYSAGPRAATPDAKKLLVELAEIRNRMSWQGRSDAAATDEAVYGGLIDTGGLYGGITETKVGWEIIAPTKDIAVACGTSDRTVAASYRRLEKLHGLIRILQWGKGRRATRLLLLKPSHISPPIQPPRVYYAKVRGEELDKKLRKIRNPTPTDYPEFDRNGRRLPQRSCDALVRCIGKPRALILKRVVLLGSPTLRKLAASLGKKRLDNLRREMQLLLDVGYLIECEGRFAASSNIEELIDKELAESGCDAAERLARERYARDREAYHSRHQHRPDPLPERPVAGSVEELERLSADIENLPHFERIASLFEQPPPWLARTLLLIRAGRFGSRPLVTLSANVAGCLGVPLSQYPEVQAVVRACVPGAPDRGIADAS